MFMNSFDHRRRQRSSCTCTSLVMAPRITDTFAWQSDCLNRQLSGMCDRAGLKCCMNFKSVVVRACPCTRGGGAGYGVWGCGRRARVRAQARRDAGVVWVGGEGAGAGGALHELVKGMPGVTASLSALLAGCPAGAYHTRHAPALGTPPSAPPLTARH
ncbi:hypothetical protein EVAR_18499_1 [Eumeta japonica]|uniref:Uncharacterized protein n=1 Tax=Eumeta variegata TaxID=151549 RepID=A0A4C1V0D8_EUMVA|nr:hypothetical protein EVAR_18499_1 [Eumeta japonica]